MKHLKTRNKTFWTVLLVLFISLSAMAGTPKNVTLRLRNVTLVQSLQELKRQTNVKFIYSDRELQNAPRVTVEKTDISLAEAMNLIFRNQPFSFELIKANVYVVKPLQKSSRQRGSRTVSGKIVDARTGEPLVGATVYDTKSQKGGMSNADGQFSFNVPADCTTLCASYVGYDTQNFLLKGNSVLVFELTESSHMLNDVVVIGYGSTQRKDLTGSVATVKTEELQALPAMSVDDALAGKASGVQVIKADGSPGGAVRIRVRGGASLSGGVDPLYIIDGIPTEITNNYISSSEVVNPLEASGYGEEFNNSISGSFARGLNSLSGLNLNDIESISILKDASATAIYGSKAANGVVIITTKKGRHDMKPKFSANYYISMSVPVKEKVLNASQYKSTLLDAAQRSVDNYDYNVAHAGTTGYEPYLTIYGASTKKKSLKILNDPLYTTDDGVDTDWLDMILRTGVAHNADFSVTGGGKSSRYYTSFSYTKQTGTLIKTDFERYAGKVSLDNDITSHFRINTNLNLSYTKNHITNGLYTQALMAPPILAAYNADGSYGSMGTLGDSYMGYQNPMAIASCTNQAKTYGFKGSISAEIDLMKNLLFKSTVSVDYSSYNQLNYVPGYVKVGGFYGAESSDGGTGTQAQSTTIGTFFENTLTWNKTFGQNHRVNALIGTSWEDRKMDYFSATGKGYPDDDYLNNLSSASTAAQVKGANPYSRSSLLSFYVRANYVFKDRYLFTFTGRSDASSKFSKNNRVGYFPSAAIAWRINEESFLKSAKWIDEIKIRASIGKTGTQNIGDHLWRTLYAPGAYAGSSAMYPSQLGNDDIKWESTTQKDLGLDFSFFNSRLGGTVAYYHKITDGALLSITPAPSSGFSSVTYNIAKIRNTGLEIELYSDFVRTKDFTWTGALNVSHNASKVLHINGNFSDAGNRSELNLGTSIVKEGESLGLLCGYESDGYVKDEADLAEYKSKFKLWPMLCPAIGVGGIKLKLKDGDYYQDERGNCTPDFFGGYTNTFSYKNWSLLAMFTFSYGNDLIYQKDVTDMAMNSLANRGTRVIERATNCYAGTINFLTNENVYDASYLKLKTLSINYAFSRNVLKKWHLNGLSLYATATNLFTITHYPGPDPEVSDNPYSITGGGRDASTYPTSKSYTFGMRLSF